MRREGECWSYIGVEYPGRPRGGDRPPCRPRGGGDRPPCRACGPGPLVARGGGDRPPFFFQGLRCKFEEKKLHFGPVALWEGDRGIFLKFSKTDIYF